MALSHSRAKQWGDDDLRTVLPSQHSWRGTARALGLKGTSAGTLRALKRRASELRLDTSHFTGQRRWSDRQLHEAIAEASSWADVINHIGLTDTAETRVRVKGHAVRLGFDVSHLLPPSDDGKVELADLSPHEECLPRAAEPFAAAWFSVRGAAVAKPDHPAAYDLLVTFGGGYQRVQVKTTRWRGEHGTWVANIGRRPYVLDNTASRMPYDPDLLDFFFIIDGDFEIYLIPSDVVAGRSGICVGAYRRFRVGNASSLFALAV